MSSLKSMRLQHHPGTFVLPSGRMNTGAQQPKPKMSKDAELCKELRDWLDGEDIPNARRDDHTLLQFLYGCKHRSERARNKLRAYFEMRRNTPEWFAERDPELPRVSRLLDLGVFMPLPRKDEEGRYVILVRATINDPRVSPMVDVFKVGMMILDLAMELDLAIAQHGVVVVIDLDHVALGHSVQMTPALIKKTVHSWQDCYPVRIKSIDFINCPIYVNVVLNIFKQFMREKLKQRVRVHGRNLSSLHQCVSPELLPEEYGGKCGPLGPIIQDWSDKVRANRTWFLDPELTGEVVT